MKCKSLLDYGSVNPLEILRDTARLGAKILLRSRGSSGQTLSIFIAALRSPRKLILEVTGRIQKAGNVLSHAFTVGTPFLARCTAIGPDDARRVIAIFFDAKHAKSQVHGKKRISHELLRIIISRFMR